MFRFTESCLNISKMNFIWAIFRFTFTILPCLAHSQCVAKAGEDAIVCIDLFGNYDHITLGGMPTASNGVSPYTYTWSCNYYFPDGTYPYPASYFLDNVSLANPTIRNIAPDLITFRVDVLDSIGQSCYDSITVRFTYFGWENGDREGYVQQGDSIRLHHLLFGGIPPITYQWFTEIDSFISNEPYPLVSPDTTTSYFLKAYDSTGCEGVDIFTVIVLTTGISYPQVTLSKSILYPNPLVDKSILKVYSSHQEYEVLFYNAIGQLIHQIEMNENQADISKEDFVSGLYYYNIISKNSIVSMGKMVVE